MKLNPKFNSTILLSSQQVRGSRDFRNTITMKSFGGNDEITNVCFNLKKDTIELDGHATPLLAMTAGLVFLQNYHKKALLAMTASLVFLQNYQKKALLAMTASLVFLQNYHKKALLAMTAFSLVKMCADTYGQAVEKLKERKEIDFSKCVEYMKNFL